MNLLLQAGLFVISGLSRPLRAKRLATFLAHSVRWVAAAFRPRDIHRCRRSFQICSSSVIHNPHQHLFNLRRLDEMLILVAIGKICGLLPTDPGNLIALRDQSVGRDTRADAVRCNAASAIQDPLASIKEARQPRARRSRVLGRYFAASWEYLLNCSAMPACFSSPLCRTTR